MGVATAGVGMGTLVMAPVGAGLVSAFGWRGALWAYALGSGLLLGAAVAAAHRPPRVAGASAQPIGAALRDATFRVLFVASLLLSIAFYTPFVFLTPYATHVGIDGARAALLVGIVGATSVVSRLVFAAFGSRSSPLEMYRWSYVVMAASFVIWLAAGSSYAMLVAHALVMGLGYGGFVALGPAVLADAYGVERLGGLIGMLYTSFGIGGLAGPSLNGVLIDNAGYRAALLTSLVAVIVAIVVLRGLRPHGEAEA
jgi:predicted MFS family arabinose efflux permease